MNARRNYTELKAQRKEATGKENLAMKEAGKFFIDIAKLVVAGVILTPIMRQDIDLTYAIIIGLLIVILLVTLGLSLIQKSNKERR